MYDIEVSVAMITYNHGKFVRQAIDSILRQKVNFKFEVIIGDDCSPDNTQEILKEYKEKYPDVINLILRKKNIGGPANIYDVYHHCRGRYIAQLEGDDFWTDDNKLQTQVDFLNNNPNILSVAHRTEIVDIEGVNKGYNLSTVKLNQFFNKSDAIKYGAGLLHPSSLVFRNFIYGSDEKYSIIRDSNKYGNHTLMIYLMAINSDIYIIDQSMSAWRCVVEENATNYTSMAQRNPYEAHRNTFIMYNNYRNYFKKDYNFDKIIVLEFISCCKLVLKSTLNKTNEIKNLYKFLTIKDRFGLPIYLIRRIASSFLRKSKSIIQRMIFNA